MPVPVSVTRIVTLSPLAAPVENAAEIVTRPPAGVYLTPLSRRLITCLIRLWTAEMVAASGSSAWSSMFFGRRASGRNESGRASRRARRGSH